MVLLSFIEINLLDYNEIYNSFRSIPTHTLPYSSKNSYPTLSIYICFHVRFFFFLTKIWPIFSPLYGKASNFVITKYNPRSRGWIIPHQYQEKKEKKKQYSSKKNKKKRKKKQAMYYVH